MSFKPTKLAYEMLAKARQEAIRRNPALKKNIKEYTCTAAIKKSQEQK
jgi:hypothetical protein